MLTRYPDKLKSVVMKDEHGNVKLKPTATEEQRKIWKKHQELLKRPTVFKEDADSISITSR